MVYSFKSGSHVRGDAQAAGEMCERLAAEGRLTAEQFVEENRPETAPMHHAFEWDNDKAADAWRVHQARHIIASIEIRTEKREPTRAYFSIERSDPTYRHIESIMQSRDETESLLRTALAELTAFQKKYYMLKELAEVFNAISEVQKGA